MGRKILDAVFSAFYFLLFYQLIKYMSAHTQVNLLFDILTVVCMLISLVISVFLADKTVNWIIKHL